MISRKRMILAGIGVVVIAALAALALNPWRDGAKQIARNTSTQQAQKPFVDEPMPPTPLQQDEVVRLVGEARRLSADGKLDEAEALLARADKVIKNAAQTAEARDEIARLKTPEGRLAAELVRARLAVEHNNRAAAEKSIAEIEKLKADAPELAELRQTLDQQQARTDRRGERIKRHLDAMRQAIERGDFAAADGELNAASRVDVTDPSVQQARRELARAHDDSRRNQRQQ